MYISHGLVSYRRFFKHLRKVPIVKKREYYDGATRMVEYINLPCSFDIETSSFYFNMNKMACMYIWQFGIDGYVVVGRTWEEFRLFMDTLATHLGLSETRRLPIYVHNLSYEFQWIKDRFHWIDIFAREKRTPMKAVSDEGFEFRCSYMLSGCSLEQTAKNLTKYKVSKKVGDLDYDLVRHPGTPLTKREKGYCVYDVICVMNYIQEEMETYGDVTKIPMTNTGKVRRYCRKVCFSEENKKAYSFAIKDLTLSGAAEYDMLKRAFTAGYTHANYMNAGEVFENVVSKDFTSSYPSVMICEQHPMSHGEWVRVKNIKQIENMLRFYYIIMNIELTNLKEKEGIPDHYILYYKCKGCVNCKTDNGRLISADKIQITITGDDWDIIKQCYDFDEPKIGKVLRYRLGYLPRAFVQCVLDFYKGKTELKDVEGMEAEYQLKKGMLNSTFGMSVTDIVNDEIFYDLEWDSAPQDVDEAIRQYNKSKNRFLFYPWGISICSKARKNLWSGILELGQDYIYSDTDSVKYINEEAHREYFNNYNAEIEKKMKKACDALKLNFEDTHPKTVKGKEKPLGVWDDDGVYKRFKTLGAKRYLVEDMEGHIKCTIAGANKKKTSQYIAEQEEPFEFFQDRMKIDEEHSGRLIHSYAGLDTPYSFEITDYLGNEYSGSEKSGVHMEKSEYNLKLSPMYMMLLNMKQKVISF